MSGAIGPDIAAVYQLLTQVARTVTGHDRKLDDLSAEVAELRGTVGGLGGVVAGLNGMVAGLNGMVPGLSEIVAGHDRKLDDLTRRPRFAPRCRYPLPFKRARPRYADQRA